MFLIIFLLDQYNDKQFWGEVWELLYKSISFASVSFLT